MGLAPRTGQVGGRQLTVGGLLWTVVVTSRDQIYQGPRPGRRCSTSSPPQVSTSTLAGLQEPVLGFRQAENCRQRALQKMGRPSPCLSGVGWNTPRAGTEEPEAMFPFLVGTTQRWRKGGLYCLPPFVTCNRGIWVLNLNATPHRVGRS